VPKHTLTSFFAPGLTGVRSSETLCKRSALPVNIMILPATPLPTQLAGFGVARISYGPSPYRRAMEALTEAARAVFRGSHTRRLPLD